MLRVTKSYYIVESESGVPWPDSPSPTMSTTCDTANAFTLYGIPDGVDLLHRMRYQLLAGGDGEFEPTDAFVDRIERAFRTAYRRAADAPEVADPLDAAVEDAAALTAEAYVDDPDADLRRDVLPSFYATLVGLFCRYIEQAWDGDFDVWLVGERPR